MSAYTTLRISRSKAQEKIIEDIMKNVIYGGDDNLLEDMMDRMLESRLYNVIIVSDDEDNDDYIL